MRARANAATTASIRNASAMPQPHAAASSCQPQQAPQRAQHVPQLAPSKRVIVYLGQQRHHALRPLSTGWMQAPTQLRQLPARQSQPPDAGSAAYGSRDELFVPWNSMV